MVTEGNGQALSSRLFYFALPAVGALVFVGFCVVLTILLFLYNEQHDRIVELEKGRMEQSINYEHRITAIEIELANIKGK